VVRSPVVGATLIAVACACHRPADPSTQAAESGGRPEAAEARAGLGAREADRSAQANAGRASDAGLAGGRSAADGEAADAARDGLEAGASDGLAQAPSSSDLGDAAGSLAAPTEITDYTCTVVRRGGPFSAFLAATDTRWAFVDGDDWLALVNRSPSGALRPDYAPSDLVDVSDGSSRKPAECESAHECLRREAAEGLHKMLDAMHGAGMEGRVQSAYRGFGTQCWVFAGWARQARAGFCEATEQSALPGHSQHQLGSTLDLFTGEWVAAGAKTGQGVFRNGFGCTAGGKWLDENAWRFGFVVSYPIHPDDRRDGSRCQARSDRAVPINPKTGYKSEPWHVRFIGEGAAARFHEAWLASGPGTPDEITLEQWLRAGRGLPGDADLPVCDGCHCGACATLAGEDARTPCGPASLQLDIHGRVASPAEPPGILGVKATLRGDGATLVDVEVHVPAHTPTQPPIVDPDGPAYSATSTIAAASPAAGAVPRAFPPLPSTWRVAIEPWPASLRWPWQASLSGHELAATWNHANVALPGHAGDRHVRVPIAVPPGVKQLAVTLLRDGAEHGTTRVLLP
jgi:D-alanyl-D-alanine carboxypeptidase